LRAYAGENFLWHAADSNAIKIQKYSRQQVETGGKVPDNRHSRERESARARVATVMAFIATC